MSTDKDSYYADESIKINASWELNYNPSIEDSYIQIHVFDNTNTLIWNSTKNNEIGAFEMSWIVNISDLNINLNSTTHNSQIKLYYYYHNYYSSQTYDFYVEEIEIQILRRDIYCQLIDFNEFLYVGSDLCFRAIFYSELIENKHYMVNHSILLNIIAGGEFIFNSSYITSEEGIIKISVSSLKLRIGENKLLFIIDGTQFYNPANFSFSFSILVNPDSKQTDSKQIDPISPIILIPIIISALLIPSSTYLKIMKNKRKNLGKLSLEL